MRITSSGGSALLLAVVAALIVAGCGSEEGDGQETQTTQPQNRAEALGPPKEKESIDKAADALVEAVKSGDCEAIFEFNPVSRAKALDTKPRCKALSTRLAGATVSGTESWDGAGVIDFTRGKQVLTTLMVVDQDGKFHLAAIDPFLSEKSVKTKFAKEFDKAADAAFQALGDKDCPAFLRVASRQVGIANIARDEKDVCALVKKNRIALLVEANPRLEPELIGGNSDYAFYGIGTPHLFITMVMARQSDELGPKLPKDAAEYAYVDSLLTNAETASDK